MNDEIASHCGWARKDKHAYSRISWLELNFGHGIASLHRLFKMIRMWVRSRKLEKREETLRSFVDILRCPLGSAASSETVGVSYVDTPCLVRC